MKRYRLVAMAMAGGLGLVTLGACNKPTLEDCRLAIANMEKLHHTDTTGARTREGESEVRRCKGGSTKAAVACAKSATTLDELKACGFMGSKDKDKK